MRTKATILLIVHNCQLRHVKLYYTLNPKSLNPRPYFLSLMNLQGAGEPGWLFWSLRVFCSVCLRLRGSAFKQDFWVSLFFFVLGLKA